VTQPADVAAPAPPASTVRVAAMILAMLLVCGFLILLLLPLYLGSRRKARNAGCANNLQQLWKMQAGYMAQFGGADHRLPPVTGGRFWLHLSRISPPLVDPMCIDIYHCPFDPSQSVGTTDYRGPSADVNPYADRDPVGADTDGHHGDGGNVLRKSSDVMSCPATDPVWAAAAARTVP